MPQKIPHHQQQFRGPRPASEVNPILCPFCHVGHPSYFAYMDHLQSSPCGIRQQQNCNQPRIPWMRNPSSFGPNNQIMRPPTRGISNTQMVAASRRGCLGMFPNRNTRLLEWTSDYQQPTPPNTQHCGPHQYRHYAWPNHPQHHYFWQRPQISSRPLVMPFNYRHQAPVLIRTTSTSAENPVRPESSSSDQDVILAAEEVVAREKGLLENIHRTTTTHPTSKTQEIAEEELTWIRDHGCQATTTDLERDAAQEDLLNLALEAEKDKEKDIHNAATTVEEDNWIDQVIVSDSNGDFVPINIEDIAQVVEVDEDGSTHRTCLKENSTDPLLGIAAMNQQQNTMAQKYRVTSKTGMTDDNATKTNQKQSPTHSENSVEAANTDETITLHYFVGDGADTNSLAMYDEHNSIIYPDPNTNDNKNGSKLKGSEFSLDHVICPHRSVVDLPPIMIPEQAKDQVSLVNLQAKVGYALIGIAGEKLLKQLGYPHMSVIVLLHRILDMAGIKIIEEGYMCSPECPTLEKTVDQLQLTFRIVKLRLRVLRSNIGKLLCLCVPEKEKWNEFGWVGKSVDEILDDLAREDIPSSEKFQDPKNSSSVDRPSIVESPSQRDIFRKPPITVVLTSTTSTTGTSSSRPRSTSSSVGDLVVDVEDD